MHYHEPGDFDYAKALPEAAPNQVKAFGAFDAAVFDQDDELLDLKSKELIAIGVASTTQCPSCLYVRVRHATQPGAGREEVARAVFVSAGLRAGAAFPHGLLAHKISEQGSDLEHFPQPGDVKHLRALRKASGGTVEALAEFVAA